MRMRAEVTGGWDIHTHLVPQQALQWAGLGEWGLALDDGRLKNGASMMPIGRLSDPGRLLEWVESQSLSGAVVSVPPPLFHVAGADVAAQYRWANALNEALADTCSTQSDRLRPLALVPLLDAQASLDFVRNLDFDSGLFVGVVVGTDSDQLAMSAPDLQPFWEFLAHESITVFIHPSSCPDPRMSDFYLTNLLGNPVETSVAVAHLIFGRVMERYNPTIVLAHGGGVSPCVVGRWEQGYASRRPGIPELNESPGETLRRFFVDGLVYDAATLEFVIKQFGLDKVLLGSDWPFPIAAESLQSALPGLGPTATQQVATNAQHAFPHLD